MSAYETLTLFKVNPGTKVPHFFGGVSGDAVHPDICLEELGKNTKILKIGRFPSQDSNRAHPKYE
jgi:hypothetical protein